MLANGVVALSRNWTRHIGNKWRFLYGNQWSFNSWNAVFLPKGTSAPIVARLNAALIAAMGKPQVQHRLRQLGANLPGVAQRTPQYLQSYVEGEIKSWRAAIKAANLTPD
jgi:tripartite-type tricarboxylate transporter receptor subunit TctC